MKQSFTGFFDIERDNARFENNLYTRKGELYYSIESGFEWDQVSVQNTDLSPQSFSAWIISQAASRGIVVVKSQSTISNNKLTLNYQIAGSQQEYSFLRVI
ncbi:TPA: hypothetical protein ACMD15_003431 [Vibrio cholerae]